MTLHNYFLFVEKCVFKIDNSDLYIQFEYKKGLSCHYMTSNQNKVWDFTFFFKSSCSFKFELESNQINLFEFHPIK